jgi:hypothetical protein
LHLDLKAEPPKTTEKVLNWSWTPMMDTEASKVNQPQRGKTLIKNHEPILNPNQLFDLPISNCKPIKAICVCVCERAGVTT